MGEEDGVANLDVVGQGDVLDLNIGGIPSVEEEDAVLVGGEDVCVRGQTGGAQASTCEGEGGSERVGGIALKGARMRENGNDERGQRPVERTGSTTARSNVPAGTGLKSETDMIATRGEKKGRRRGRAARRASPEEGFAEIFTRLKKFRH